MISSAARRTARGSSGVSRALQQRRVISRNRGILAAVARHQKAATFAAHRQYTTERVVELRSGRKIPTLYDGTRETENCGVGLVASLKSIASRRVVEDADEMLVRMAHRGGCGCDPASGDGAGT
jgi:Glutamine amidotransferases class-II